MKQHNKYCGMIIISYFTAEYYVSDFCIYM